MSTESFKTVWCSCSGDCAVVPALEVCEAYALTGRTSFCNGIIHVPEGPVHVPARARPLPVPDHLLDLYSQDNGLTSLTFAKVLSALPLLNGMNRGYMNNTRLSR